MQDRNVELSELLHNAGPRLFTLLVRITWSENAAADLLQDLFLKLARSAAYRSARDPAGYLYRSAIHAAFDWRRQQKRMQPLSVHSPSGEPGPLAKLIADEELQETVRALDGLSRLTRDAVVLRHLHEESFEEIGRRLGKSPHQARALCHKGLVALRKALQENPVSGRIANDPCK